MFFYKSTDTLYLNSWNFNAALIIEELRRIVESEGGRVEPTTPGYIVNRSINESIEDKKTFLERVDNNISKASSDELEEKLAKLKAATQTKIDRLEAIDNSPVQLTGAPSYIIFALNGVYYSYYFDDNPFFEFHFSKKPIVSGKISLDIPVACDKKEWLHDCFFYPGCSEADIKEAANIIFNTLISAKIERPVIDRHKKRVPNYYDGGYHYEYIYEKERFQTVNF